MSADSTELTFIRCSSCRSLVPAMSTRCRMCGADLQAKKSTPDPELAKPKEAAEVPPAVNLVAESDDPLNEFLRDDDLFDDVDVAEELPEDFLAEESSDSLEHHVEDDFDEEQAIRELDSLLEELNASNVAASKSEAVKAPKVTPTPIKPELLVKNVEPQEIIPQKLTQEERRAPLLKKNLNSNLQTKATNKLEVKEEKKMEKEIRAVETKVSPIKSAGVIQAQKTALFGWFVSYQDATGVSREIREGKFFVTGKSLKPNDLIIEDDTVSTPHAMITVSHELGFQIQDLMSEHGLYIKKYGTKKYEVIDDIEVVENGDWVRFGNVEFLVVIMPA